MASLSMFSQSSTINEDKSSEEEKTRKGQVTDKLKTRVETLEKALGLSDPAVPLPLLVDQTDKQIESDRALAKQLQE